MAAKFDMKAEASPARTSPRRPLGMRSLRTMGRIFSKSGLGMAKSSGIVKARAKAVMAATIMYRGKRRTTLTMPFMSDASRGLRVARMRCMS